ncbi:MAG: prepilin-type N-terminal cleavage/methylation domain-containing protein, partial [Bacilli bacterium]|nr:prepilin-type N-terminal cleavage/methylation domain-containing protein [Bacilli bacterium]
MKKGFTLIELLAVIVILAIIALIAVPLITDFITKSRYGAFGVSKKNIERAAELYYARNAASVTWDNDVSYVTIGTLKAKKFLSNNTINNLNSKDISDDTKVLLYREGRKISYALQLYDEQFFDWYQKEMIKAVSKDNSNLPNIVGDIKTIDLDSLIDKELVDELRLPLELENRCVGYVEIEKITTKDYEYNAYVDCLQNASTFASHYVSYGGKYLDEFFNVKETSDGGYIAVGRSNSEVIPKYGTDNNGLYDAIIVKFDSNGNVAWSDNFGGTDNELFRAVVETSDGYIAVGSTASDDIDITDFKGGSTDGLIVKYNKQGQVVKGRSFGTSHSYEHFMGIDVSGSSVVVFARIGNKNDGDMLDVEGLVRGLEGVVIKFNLNLDVESFGFFTGYNNEEFNNGIVTSDSNHIVVGFSTSRDYDMEGIGYTTENFQEEAIIVKMSNTGSIIAKNSIRGSNQDYFYDVVEVTDGYIAVGYSKSNDQDITGLSKANNGYYDAIIVKFDKILENIIWKKSFGGSNDDGFYSIEKVNNNEIMVVGYSKSDDMDMNGIAKSSDGYSNAIVVKYSITNGDIISKKAFGGTNSEIFSKVIRTTGNQYIIAGSSYSKEMDLKNFNKG